MDVDTAMCTPSSLTLLVLGKKWFKPTLKFTEKFDPPDNKSPGEIKLGPESQLQENMNI